MLLSHGEQTQILFFSTSKLDKFNLSLYKELTEHDIAKKFPYVFERKDN